MVPKKNGSLRPVLDLKDLNPFVRKCHFKMESRQSVLSSIEENEFMTVIDIKDAYLHIPIHPAHHGFLRFYVDDQHWQFVALPFGLSSAPRTFTKVMATALEELRLKGITVIPYLDDLLVQGPSAPVALQHTSLVLETLTSLGWTINFKKSNLHPTQSIVYLGLVLDSSQGKAFLPRDKAMTLQSRIRSLMGPNAVPLRAAMQTLGTMVASFPAIPYAQAHTRPLQHTILLHQRRDRANLDRKIIIPSRVQLSLHWWLQPHRSTGGKFFPPPPALDGSHHGRQSTGVGRGHRPNHSSGSMDPRGNEATHQPSGAQSDPLLTRTHGVVTPGKTGADPVRQRDGSGLHKSSGRNQKCQGPQGSSGDPKLGRKQRSSDLRGPHSRCGQLDSGLSEQGADRSRGMEPTPRDVPPHCRQVGATRDRPHGVQAQQTGPTVRLQKPRPPGPRGGRTGASLAILQGLHLSPPRSSTESCQKDNEGKISHHSSGPILAPKVFVRRHCKHGGRRTLPSPAADRPTHSRSSCPPELSSLGFNGVALEALILRRSGAPPEPVPTMLAHVNPSQLRYTIGCGRISSLGASGGILTHKRRETLSFLQEGLANGLALSSLKVHVSALSILLQKKLALHPNIKTFLQGATRIFPPYRCPVPPWDLNLVLSTLQEAPIEPWNRFLCLPYLKRSHSFWPSPPLGEFPNWRLCPAYLPSRLSTWTKLSSDPRRIFCLR
ncbi:uncharacterized protein LOC121393288 [Xenopus laevis]|uniref:ribonuclease H n=1 Tax=Xenopus laevis TaxID=8355 RepID=A0A8J1KLR0_XENLA|nr:uncharacterized protein LOC121393288 [Xenopus laevis]